MIDPIKGSILKSHVNSILGSLLLGSCALWAGMAIIQTAWLINPVTTAFAAMVEKGTTLPVY